MSLVPEPDRSASYQKPDDSFFDYEQFLPQDRLAQNQAPAQQQQQQQQQQVQTQPARRNIMQELLSYKAPQPTFDKNRPEELKRIARSTAISKGINLLGDTLALAKGANVNRRQDKGEEFGLLNSMYKNIDDYNRRMDDWNWRDFTSRLRTGEMALSQQNRQEDRSIQQQRWGKEDERWDKTFGQREKQMEQMAKDKAEDNKRMDARYAEQAALARERLDWDKVKHYNDLALQAAAQSLKQTEKGGYMLHSSDGKQSVQIQDNGELQKLYTLIVNDPALQQNVNDRIKVLAPSFGQPGSVNEQKIIVSEFWERSNAAQKYLQGSGKTEPTQQQSFNIPQMWQSPGYQGPVRQQSQPNAQQQQPTQQQFDNPDPLGLGI